MPASKAFWNKPKPLTDRQKANIAARKSAARAAKKASGKKSKF